MKYLKEFNSEILNGIRDAIAIINPKTYKIISANSALLKSLGLENKDIIGKTCYEVTHNLKTPCKSPLHICPLEETLRTEKCAISEHIHYNKFNNEIYVEISTHPIKNEFGKIDKIIHIARDITEKKISEHKIKKEKAFSEKIIETANVLIVGLDLKGNITLFNKKCEEVTGYNRKEILNTNWFELFLPERFKKESLAIFNNLIEGSISSHYENTIIAKDGTERMISWNNTVLKDEFGNIVTIVSIGEDITEKKKLEEEIKKTKNYLESIITNSADAIIATDLSGHVVSWNKAAEKIYGWTENEVIGKIVPTVPSPELEKALKKISNGEVIIGYESVRWHKNGSKIFVNTTISPILDSTGKIIGASGITRDITEKKKLEKQLQEYTENLERIIEHRTLELQKSKEALEFDKKKLEELALKLEHSNKLKDLFIDIMRHDLLNPAGIIKGYCNLILKSEKDETKKKYLQKVHNNLNRLIERIENASKLSKLESEEKLEFKQLDLKDIFLNVIENFKTVYKEKNITVQYNAKGKCYATVNPFIEEVFSNLLSNAIKYSPENSKIIIDIMEEEENWKIMVKDYGIGIADEYKKLVFDRFKRRNKEGVKGTGLGLAIVKRIVELHRGKVWIEDNPENGSVFYVLIPKKQECR